MNDIFTKKSLLTALHTVEGWLSEHEALLLYILAKKIPASGEIVEIGSYKGRSTIALAAGIIESKKKGMVWSVDPHDGIIHIDNGSTHRGTFAAFQKNIRNANVENFVHPIVNTSKKAAKEWKKPIRLLFLDGLHDFEHTREDYRVWSPWVVKGGVIAFHDAFCGEKGVWNVVNEYVFRRKDIVDIGTTSSIIYIIIGNPSFFSKARVRRKKRFIRIAMWIHKKRIPWLVKKFGIHVGIRMMLLTKYTLNIYKR